MGRTRDTRQRLLEAALDLIWTNSFGGVSVEQICERAEVNKGSFYHFFESKTALAVAAIDAGWEFKKPEYDAIFSAQNPPLERLSRWCTRSILDQREKLVHYGRVCGCPVATMGSEMANQDEILRAKCEELMARALRYLESAIRDAKAEGLIAVDDVPSAALQVHCLYLGQMIQARVRNDLSLLEHLEDSVFRFLGASHPVKA